MDTKILNKIKSSINEEEVLEIIRKLVNIPSHPGIENQETGVAKYIKLILREEGIAADVIPISEGRCNIVARIIGTGEGKNLLLAGHTDTVPPYDMQDPYNLKKDGIKLYGRGAVDMKGALSCMIAAMIGIKRAGIELKGDLVFAGVIDEEEGSLGTIALLEDGIDVDGAIVGEPTKMEICVAHRGLEWIEFHFEGETVHGGKQEEGINAILKASDFIQTLEEKVVPDIYSKKHPIIGTSSMNYGIICGGTQPSTVAGQCVVKIDRRWVPGEKYKDVLGQYQKVIDEMSKKDPKFKCEMKIMQESIMKGGYVHECMETDIDNPIVSITKTVADKICNKETKFTYFPAWSDGGLLSSYGKIPTIIFGPGDIKTAHSPNEFIDKNDVYPATLVYALTAIEFCNQ